MLLNALEGTHSVPYISTHSVPYFSTHGVPYISNSHFGNNVVTPAGCRNPVPPTVTGQLRKCLIKHPHSAEFAILGRWIPSSLTE
jgi:hypothetical protein